MEKGKRIDANGWYASDSKLFYESPGLDRDVKLRMQGDHWKGVSVSVRGYAKEFDISPNRILRIMKDFRAMIIYPNKDTKRTPNQKGRIQPQGGDWSEHSESRMIGFKDVEDLPPPKLYDDHDFIFNDDDLPF